MDSIMSYEKRQEIIGKLFHLSNEYDKAHMLWSSLIESDSDDADIKAKEADLKQLDKEIESYLTAYTEGLPVRTISRCPFSGEELAIGIDDFGLDGLWWNYDAPKRPENKLPKTYLALDGALKLSGTPENTPFPCSPGPDVPFVLPRLLEYTQVRAVISCIKIGSHTAYPIVYYTDPMLYGIKKVNDWGTQRYWEEESPFPELLTPGQYVCLSTNPEEYDFDLAPWIRKGKLLWIAPDDPTFTLRSFVARCPYIDLPGSRFIKYIQYGEVREYDQEYEMFEDNDPDFDIEHFKKVVEAIEKEE